MTELEYLRDVLLVNIDHSFGTTQLQAFIDIEGDVKLAQAAAYEVEASKVMFSFRAGETSADKSKYATNLIKMSRQIREDSVTYSTDVGEWVSWSGSAVCGTDFVQDFIDDDYNEPSW